MQSTEELSEKADELGDKTRGVSGFGGRHYGILR
jgi:hypothetical protein